MRRSIYREALAELKHNKDEQWVNPTYLRDTVKVEHSNKCTMRGHKVKFVPGVRGLWTAYCNGKLVMRGASAITAIIFVEHAISKIARRGKY